MPDIDGKEGSAIETCLVLLLILFVLNIIDAVVTLIVVHSGLAEELNLLPKMLLGSGPFVFLSVKIVGVSAALAWAWWRLRKGGRNLHIIRPVLIGAVVMMALIIGIGISALAV